MGHRIQAAQFESAILFGLIPADIVEKTNGVLDSAVAR